MALRRIQRIFHRRAVDGNTMNHVLFQQRLYRPVKRNPVIHISHFGLDIALRQGHLLIQQDVDNRYALGAFLKPFLS